MGTLVAFHAHPDDESIAMGGTIARAVDEGHRVVIVFATRGECGEVADGVLAEGETLGDRRAQEVARSAEILGAQHHAFLGYRDSGMMAEPTNDDPACFWQADVDEAAARLAEILVAEGAEVLTIYDDHGGYGHPDHIQVHRVGLLAAERASTPSVFESTMNRDHLSALMAKARDLDPDFDPPEIDEGARPPDQPDFGSPESMITTTVDVGNWVERKRASMVAHATQITEESFFSTMPDEIFTLAFGSEWYIQRSPRGEPRTDWLFPADRDQEGRS